jgi:hypothetical protein
MDTLDKTLSRQELKTMMHAANYGAEVCPSVERVAFLTYLGFHHHKLMVHLLGHEDRMLPEDYEELMQSFMVCYGTITEIQNKYLEALDEED